MKIARIYTIFLLALKQHPSICTQANENTLERVIRVIVRMFIRRVESHIVSVGDINDISWIAYCPSQRSGELAQSFSNNKLCNFISWYGSISTAFGL